MNLVKIKLKSEDVPRTLILFLAVVAGLGLGFGPGLAMDQYRKEPPSSRSSIDVEKKATLNITNITQAINITNITDIIDITNFTNITSITNITNATSTLIEIDVNNTSNKVNNTNSMNGDLLEAVDLSTAPSLATVKQAPTVTPTILNSFSPTTKPSLSTSTLLSPSLSPSSTTHESNQPSFKSNLPSILSSSSVPSSASSLSVSVTPSTYLLHSQSPSSLNSNSTNITNTIITNTPSQTPQNDTNSVTPTTISSEIQINKEAPRATNMPSIVSSMHPSITTTKSFSPSKAPKTRNEIEMILTSVSGLDALNEAGTYQNKAFSWLLETFVFSSETDDYQIKQKYILATVYFATGGDNWTHKYNFLSPDMHECTWKGLETGLLSGVQQCNDDLQVTKLSLASVSMVGRIPPELGYLTSLEFLNLIENNLEGAIPVQTFRYLSSLKSARFQSNFLYGDVTSLCDAWDKNIKVFHVDRDQINCPCCTCCPFDQ